MMPEHGYWLMVVGKGSWWHTLLRVAAAQNAAAVLDVCGT